MNKIVAANPKRIVLPIILFSALCISPFVNANKAVINGAEVFNNNCARCHNARAIDEYSLDEWAVIMPHMRERAHLTGRETEAVMQFIRLVKNGDRQPDSTSMPLPDGESLYKKYSCQGCHSVKGSGGSVGPALDTVIQDKGKEFFFNKMRNPQFNNPVSPMPRMPLTDEEIEAIEKYLSTL